jgi:D-cysteine desulfhydrase
VAVPARRDTMPRVTEGAARLHQRFPQLRQRLPRLELCRLPTPVRELSVLAREAGLDQPLWLKDDSRSAELWGGNKPRKLEWVLADARRRRFASVLTFGGLATNHGLATALYARQAGLGCVLVLVDQPLDEHVQLQLERIRASGARVVVTHDIARTLAALPWLLARHAQGSPPRPPYVLPPGGSSPVGALGFVEAGLELAAQVRDGELPEPAAIVTALGSGGTAAGLLLGTRLGGLRSRVLAVLVNDRLALSERTLLKLARRTRSLLERRGAPAGQPAIESSALEVVRGWMGEGYGHHTPDGDAAVALADDAEGLRLEHVYTGKALAALLALSRSGRLGDGPILYWHTHSGVEAPPAR